MPCLNEARTLETCIRKAQGFLQKSGIRGEVVVGDNGSTDGSQEIARRCGARVVDVPVRGYGAALYGATLAARGTYVIMGDSDDSYDFSDLAAFVEKLRAGYDLVMGNRFRGGIKPGAMPWKNKHIGNPAITAVGRLFFRCPSKDFLCGLRGYSADAFRRMGLVTAGMEYAAEMVIKATLLHMRIAEVPTTLSPDGRGRAPHLRPWRDGWRYLRFMGLYSPKWLFFYPGILLMLAGGVGLAALLPGPLRLGGVTLDVNTLLYAAAAVLVGFQGVSFAVLAKGFAVTQGLVPSGGLVKRTVGTVRTEFGIFAGLGLFLAGLAGSFVALAGWGAVSFGDLDTSRSLRVVIPSVLGLVLGGQTLLASFFLDVMRLHLRSRPTATGSGV
ncbi:MAG: dolichol-P-glucose synthetase [Isosphaera sp.]|nr:dolichol-P-glucose synthetase [Isosphaera sp.]